MAYSERANEANKYNAPEYFLSRNIAVNNRPSISNMHQVQQNEADQATLTTKNIVDPVILKHILLHGCIKFSNTLFNATTISTNYCNSLIS